MTLESVISFGAVVLAMVAVVLAIVAVRRGTRDRLDEQEIAMRAVALLRADVDQARQDAASAQREASEARRESAEARREAANTRRFNDALLRYIDDLLAGIERMYAQIAATGATPVYRPGPRPMPPSGAPDSNVNSSMVPLLHALETLFDMSELDALAQGLDTTIEHVGGDNLRDTALRLMRYAQSREKLDTLCELVRAARPTARL